jgi:drug/metabolite transporter (DMT)-like permease
MSCRWSAATHIIAKVETQDPEHVRAQSTSLWPVASLAAAGSLWGTGFLFGKISFTEMTVSENVGYRFLIASLAFAPILWKRPVRLRGWHARLLLLGASIIGVPIEFLLQFKGLELTTVSHASLIVGTLPVLLALGSALWFKDRLKLYEYGVMLISAAGAVLIAFSKSSGGTQSTLPGDLLVFVSMFAAVVMMLITKRLISEYGSLPVTAAMIITGTVILLVWIEATHPLRFHFSSGVWLAVIAQGLLATTAAYGFWNWGLARVPAARAGVFLNLEPLVGTILAW